MYNTAGEMEEREGEKAREGKEGRDRRVEQGGEKGRESQGKEEGEFNYANYTWYMYTKAPPPNHILPHPVTWFFFLTFSSSNLCSWFVFLIRFICSLFSL